MRTTPPTPTQRTPRLAPIPCATHGRPLCNAGAGGKAATELKKLKDLSKKEVCGELEEEDVAELERLAKAEESNNAKLRNTNDRKADGGARHAHPRPQRTPRLPGPSHGTRRDHPPTLHTVFTSTPWV